MESLSGDPFSFCVGDGIRDTIADGEITLMGNSGDNSRWVITDTLGNILGLPPTLSDANFDGAGAGICWIRNLSFADGLSGDTTGGNISTLQGCFSLSNFITVERTEVIGGTLSGDPFSFCVGDGIRDTIADGEITLMGNSGDNSRWIITDTLGNILGLPPTLSDANFDGAGAGICWIRNLSFADGLSGDTTGGNISTLQGCFSLSNSIIVVRSEVNGGNLTGNDFSFCVGDGIRDTIADGEITLMGNSGDNNRWVITDTLGNILGLPPTLSDANFDGAGAGICWIRNLSFADGLSGDTTGGNISTLQGCFSLSNFITIERTEVIGGILSGDPFSFCVGDGIRDTIAEGEITLMGNSGDNNRWVITDTLGNILGLPPTLSDANFDGAGAGICWIRNLSFADGLSGDTTGGNISTLQGCFSLSNSIIVVRSEVNGGNLTGDPFSFCVGDGIRDTIADGEITLMGNSGDNNRWIITDTLGNILGLPPTLSDANFDGAGAGICWIRNLSFDDGLSGDTLGGNISTLQGCFSLSNFITVERTEVIGGTLSGDPFSFCVGDGIRDTIADGEITLMGNSGDNSRWVITDTLGNILGLPPTLSDANFDGAGAGICWIRNLSFADGLSGDTTGGNISTLQGCFSLSNFITVERTEVNGGTLSGDSFSFCVGDGIRDTIADGEITLMGNSGDNNRWVITDTLGNILGLPPTLSDANFDGAGAGICWIRNLSFADGLSGDTTDGNISTLQGCFSLSNFITVERTEVIGGTLSGDPFSFCVGDGIWDTIADGEITLMGNSGANNRWVITDTLGNILGLPPTISDANFDGAGAGICWIRNLSFADGLSGDTTGGNISTLQGCFSLSNFITVERSEVIGGTLSGDPFFFCVGDGIWDTIADGEITLMGNSGDNSRWIITDTLGNILGLPPTLSDANFDGAGAGICWIRNLSFADGLSGDTTGR